MERGNQMKTKVEVQEDKKERKKKKKEEIAIQRKQVFSEQVDYLCLSVGEWVLLLRQECLPVRDH
jgi:hypothetical protein